MTIFNTLVELVTSVIAEQFDKKLQQVLDNQTRMLANQTILLAGDEVIREDLLSIKVFLGIPDVRVGATQEQLDVIGQRLKTATAAVQAFDKSITDQQPAV